MDLTKKILLLDRDGVINFDSDEYVKSVEEWVAIPGSLEAIARASQLGFKVFVITNQSGLARGYFTEATLKAMHDKLIAGVTALGGQIAGIYYCPHGPDDGCDCRKPKAGMLRQIATEHHLDLSGVPLVGDSLRDLQCADAVAAQGILVRTGKGERTLLKHAKELQDYPVFDNLQQFVDQVIAL